MYIGLLQCQVNLFPLHPMHPLQSPPGWLTHDYSGKTTTMMATEKVY